MTVAFLLSAPIEVIAAQQNVKIKETNNTLLARLLHISTKLKKKLEQLWFFYEKPRYIQFPEFARQIYVRNIARNIRVLVYAKKAHQQCQKKMICSHILLNTHRKKHLCDSLYPFLKAKWKMFDIG